LGLYKKDENNKLVSIREIVNQTYLDEYQLKKEDLESILKLNQTIFERSFEGESILYNASPGSKEPVFVISFPQKDDSNNEIVITILKLDKIESSFKKEGLNTTFLVNGDGLLIAHHDEQLLFTSANFSDNPIVKIMLLENQENGNKKFADSDGKRYMGAFNKIGFANSGVVTLVEEDKVMEPVFNIQRRNIYIMIIGIAASLIIVFALAKSISNPVISLLHATVEIAKGNFRVNIKSTTSDEVGLLTDYFVTMGEGLEEREKVKSILGNMIDPVVVGEAMKDMAALKRGSEKQITAFFSDVAGFSTISEQLTSVDLAALLNEYLSAMTLILKQYDGVLDKYIGDAIVGIFNAPVDVATHPLKASLASLDMIDKLRDLKEYWTKNNLYTQEAREMDVRIGLNLGPAKVGFMGTDALASYTMMGDTVNLAARLEAAGKDYGVNILISENLNKEIESELFTRGLDLVRVKGKNEPVKLFELISRKSDIKSNIKESSEIYQVAFSHYLKQEWDKAIQLFQEAKKAKGTKDKAIEQLIDRCSYYKISSPGSDWDGVFTRKTK
jgi:adenylate cyclase